MSYKNDAGEGSGTTVMGQAFDRHCSPIGPEVAASQPSAMQTEPEVIALANGNYVLLHVDETIGTNTNVRGRIFTPEGEVVPGTAPFDVPSAATAAGNQFDIEAAALSDGRFVVVWRNVNGGMGDNSHGGIFAQIFNADGSRSGEQIRVNSTTLNYQTSPTVSALPGGGFAVAFTDYSEGQGFEKPQVRLITFDNRGIAGSADMLVDASTTQTSPSLTTLADGRVVVGWVHGSAWAGIFDPRSAGMIVNGTSNDDHYIGSAFTDVLNGGHGNDILVGGAGNDVLDGGSGSDTAVFSGNRAQYAITHNTDGSLTITGPDGIDQLTDMRVLQFKDSVEALTNAAPTGLSLSRASIVENAPKSAVVGTLAAQDADGDALTYSLAPGSSGSFGIIGNSLVVTGRLDFETKPVHQLTVQARDAYGGVTSLNVNVTVTNVMETTPFTITGTPRADTLSGEAGNDTIYGSGGNDVLTGHAGKDVFVFDTRLNKRMNVDKIVDYDVRDDSVYLDNKVFTKLGSGSFLKPKKFKSDMFVKSTKAQDAEDRIVYDKKTGALYYDQDGTGSKAQVKIGTLSKNLKLTYSDFFVI